MSWGEPSEASGSRRIPNNIPMPLTTLIGRAAETAEVARLLAEHRLVTLTGAGGCGKTRLALCVAAEVRGSFRDGVWFVDLGPIGQDAGVARAVAAVLGASLLPGQDPLDAVAAHAAASKLLIVLDNCEHVVEACCVVSDAIRRACPHVRILVTSREILGAEGEVAWRVPSLSLPPSTPSPTVQDVAGADAVRLFVDRATLARPNFVLTNETAREITAICRRLDGIPLAIELAAARVRVLSPAEILAGLDDRFRLLGSGNRAALGRHQTLTASVAWSYDLLTDDERAAFRRLSAFSGTFDLDTAEAAAAADGVESRAVLDLLSALVDKSLVIAEDRGASTRYRMLETLQAFGRERLANSAEMDGVYERVARHYLAQAVSVGNLDYGRLMVELENIRAAITWALDCEPQLALELSTAVALVVVQAGDVQSARRWLEQALAKDPGTDRRARARALAHLAYASFAVGDLIGIPAIAEEAVTIGREVKDDRTVARALNARGWALGSMFGVEAAEVDLREAIDLARRSGDTWCLIESLKSLGYVTVMHDDPAGGRIWLEEAVNTARSALRRVMEEEASLWLAWADLFLGNLRGARSRLERLVPAFQSRDAALLACLSLGYQALTLALMGEAENARARIRDVIARSRPGGKPLLWLLADALTFAVLIELAAGELTTSQTFADEASEVCGPGTPPVARTRLLVFRALTLIELGDLAGARAANDEALAVAEPSRMKWTIAFGRLNAARLAALEGQPDLAEDLAHESLVAAHEMQDQLRMPEALEFLARLDADAGHHAETTRLLGAAAALRDRSGYALFALDRPRLEDLSTAMRSVLGDAEFNRLLDEGKALDTDAAVSYARRGRGERRRPSSGWDALTPTELEVTRLVAQGLTNPQVAERLFVTRSTVKAHLGHVFAKLGVSTRAELAAVATRNAVSSDHNERP